MESKSATVESILAAARRAISARGPDGLTMSAVALAAEISRPTLYRWFPRKTDLLEAIAAHEEQQFDLGLQEVIASHRSPARQLDAVLHYLVHWLDESMMPDPIGVDPPFALGWLAKSLEPHVEILARLLGDAWLQVPAVRAGKATKRDAAEMFLRLAYSHYLVPSHDSEDLVGAMRRFAGLPKLTARPKAV